MFRVPSKSSCTCSYSAWSSGSFFFLLLCFWASCGLTSSSIKIIERSFDSSMANMMLSNSSVNDQKIFSITRLASIGSPFLSSWLATYSTRVMYSVTCSLSSILRHSNSHLRVCSQTCLMWSLPLYATSRISHASS